MPTILDRIVETKHVIIGHKDMYLSGQLGGKGTPIVLQNDSEIVVSPGRRYRRIDCSRLTIPEIHRAPVFTAGAEHGLECAQHPSVADHPVGV